MNYLKTYEAYFDFKGFYTTEEDLFKFIGVNRELIKDNLIELEDKMPWAHISIDFTRYVSDYYDQPLIIRYVDGELFENGVKADKVNLRVNFYPNKERLDYLREKYSDREIVDKKWIDIMLDGTDISDELKSLKLRLSKLGFDNIKITENYTQSPSEKIYTRNLVAFITPKNLDSKYGPVGHRFLMIEAQKEVNKK